MDFMTVKESSLLWHMDISTIGKLLRKGKIPGATKLGGHWVIPKATPRPIDGRLKTAKETKNTGCFRFPLYINKAPDSSLYLNLEETKIYEAQKDFFACNFSKAKDAFEELSEKAENIYIKICSLFFMCILSSCYDRNINFKKYFYSLQFR